MYANYFELNNKFIERLNEREQEVLSGYIYAWYLKLHKSKSHLLTKEKFLASNRTQTAVTFLFCPKCKESGFVVTHGLKQAVHNQKYCYSCGEPSIDYKFATGMLKITTMIQHSSNLQVENKELSRSLNQQIIALISSVYEVYLREFYADILNSKFVKNNLTLYDKFLRDCKNDFLNPGKTLSRFKSDLQINYKAIVGEESYKSLDLLGDYRNVIVHNNGLVDSIFTRKHPTVELRSIITPSIETILVLFSTIVSCVRALDIVYQEELKEWVTQNICSSIKGNALVGYCKRNHDFNFKTEHII